MLLDAGVVTRCRRRVHLDNDPQARDLPKAPVDPGIEQRVSDAADHRRAIADRLEAALGESWARIPRDASRRQRERETLTAMRDGVRFISGAQLPADPEAGRFGGIDLLVRVDSGYLPVLVVRHKTTDPGNGARTSPVEDPLPGSARRDPRRKVRSQPRDQLRLAHLVRLLAACGMAAPGNPTGGVIGVDGDVVVWHDLLAPNWPGGRTALAEYDARFTDRVAVATAAATGAEPLARPSRVTECKGCPWWPTCSAELREARDVSLVVRGE